MTQRFMIHLLIQINSIINNSVFVVILSFIFVVFVVIALFVLLLLKGCIAFPVISVLAKFQPQIQQLRNSIHYSSHFGEQ